MDFQINNATTFALTVNALKVAPVVDSLSNVVTHVDYTLTASRDGLSAAMPISQDMAAPDANTFVDFNSLTANTVVGWLTDMLGSDTVSSYQSMIDRQIDRQIAANATVAMSPPWIANATG